VGGAIGYLPVDAAAVVCQRDQAMSLNIHGVEFCRYPPSRFRTQSEGSRACVAPARSLTRPLKSVPLEMVVAFVRKSGGRLLAIAIDALLAKRRILEVLP